ncbi:amidohydrolase family protein [Kribbella sp. NPDC055071]
MMSTVIAVESMFDGAKMVGPSTIHLADGKIIDVRPRTAGTEGIGAEVIDLGPQRCLLPGLIDCHVHLAFDAGLDPVADLIAADDSELMERMRRSASTALDAGITTVRDLGDRNYLAVGLANDLKGRPAHGPEVLAAGPPITTPGGHCHFLGGETKSSSTDLRTAVQTRHAKGCTVVKVMASGGNITPGSVPHKPQYDAQALRTVVEEAHRLGLPVAAHVHSPASIADAIDAGVDTLEHVTFWTADGPRPDRALLSSVANSNIFVSMTLGMLPGAERPASFAQLDIVAEAYRDLRNAGARLIVGTDAGVSARKPHNILPYAVGELPAIGWSPLEALSSVTSLAADACGVGHRKGRIQIGFDADFVVVEGDPLANLDALHQVHMVFRDGFQVR